jgi:hypothetical protein
MLEINSALYNFELGKKRRDGGSPSYLAISLVAFTCQMHFFRKHLFANLF